MVNSSLQAYNELDKLPGNYRAFIIHVALMLEGLLPRASRLPYEKLEQIASRTVSLLDKKAFPAPNEREQVQLLLLILKSYDDLQ